MRKLRIVRAAAGAVLLALISGRAFAQTPAATAPWQGWIQCQVTVQGGGYSNSQIHTWTITGAPTLVGSIAEYPVTWTVAGAGTYRTTNLDQTIAAQWSTNGSLPSPRIGIFIRASDGRLVALFRSAQFNVPSGTTGTQQVSAAGSQPQTRSINLAIYEWRPLPVMEDAATSTHLSGSVSTPIANRLDPLQPAGATGQAVCTWDFARSPAVPAPIPSGSQLATSSAAATGTTVSAPTVSLSTAASAGTIQPAPITTTTTSTTTRERTLSPNVTAALTAITASAPTTVNATVTPAGVVRGAFSGPTKLSAGAQGTFQLALTVPPPAESTVQYQPSNGQSGETFTTVQTVAKTTTSFVIQSTSLTFDSNEGETTAATLPSASSSPSPLSATFTFQTAGTYSVSVRGTVSTQSRAETVNTVTTTVTTLDRSCKCMKPVSSSTTIQPTVTQISTNSYQISAPLQLTVGAQ